MVKNQNDINWFNFNHYLRFIVLSIIVLYLFKWSDLLMNVSEINLYKYICFFLLKMVFALRV